MDTLDDGLVYLQLKESKTLGGSKFITLWDSLTGDENELCIIDFGRILTPHCRRSRQRLCGPPNKALLGDSSTTN